MAVNDALPGAEVTIEVNGQALEELTEVDADESPKTITRYLCVTSGQLFTIRYSVKKGVKCLGDRLHFQLDMDGVRIPSSSMYSSSIAQKGCVRVMEGLTLSGNRLQRFRFDAVGQTDEMPAERDTALAKSIGTIRIEVHHKNVEQVRKYDDAGRTGPGIISEKALKGQALSHGVGFDEVERQVSGRVRRHATFVDPQEVPVATYVFKYRSLEALKSESIVPRTPSPTPLEKREELTSEELRELQRQIREFKANASNIKREHVEDRDEKPNKRARNLPASGDVLLTIDDAGVSQTPTTNLPPRRKPEVIEINSD
ncbi:hypothetical protein Slin14017_G094660 [Septoria linicola]|nr:hypothetical protein Slin14017_G094660 [Septoria linicola]